MVANILNNIPNINNLNDNDQDKSNEDLIKIAKEKGQKISIYEYSRKEIIEEFAEFVFSKRFHQIKKKKKNQD